MKVPRHIYYLYKMYHRAYCRFCYPQSIWTHINAEQKAGGPTDSIIFAFGVTFLAVGIFIGIRYLTKGS
jgi:hypothetical protein